MFQMASQVCSVTLGGIWPADVSPLVLYSRVVSWPAHRDPCLACRPGEVGTGFPSYGFGTHCGPLGHLCPMGCGFGSEDSEQMSSVLRL